MQHEERPQGNSPEVFRQASSSYIRVIMDKYIQLSFENRHQIQALLESDLNQSEIARTICVHRSTVSHELKRNVTGNSPQSKSYCPEADQLASQAETEASPICRGPKAQARGG